MNRKSNSFFWAELREFRPAFASLMFFSFIITLLALVPTIFMQQIYERVMQSRSYSTLWALAGIAVFLTIVWTALEVLRIRVLQRIAYSLDEKISARVFTALNRQTDGLNSASRGLILQDLNTIRDFIGGNLIIQFLDFLWVPLIIAVGFLFHPVLGIALLVLSFLVAGLALLSQSVARKDVMTSLVAASQANEFGRAIMHSAEPARVLGMLPALIRRWRSRQRDMIGWQQHAADRASPYVNLLRLLRHLYLPIMLVIGALLFLSEQVGAGVIFGASILVGRAVNPVDIIANSWRSFWNANMSIERIDAILEQVAKGERKVSLPRPHGPLVVSRVSATPRNRDLMILSDVSFSVGPGKVVGVVGSSGAGKSTLARVLVGAWAIARGSVSLDSHELGHWDQDNLGQHIGYVPQDVELLPGTVAENIARFDPIGDGADQKVLDAVRLAMVQDIIGKLPNGLNTRLGPDGHVLSSGQRQRIALARAVYGMPRLVVLDEPNSNLDAVGEQQLAQTIAKLRNDDAIVILITHRMNMLSICDHVLVMNAGTVHAFGDRDHVLNRLSNFRPKELPGPAGAKPGPGGTVAA